MKGSGSTAKKLRNGLRIEWLGHSAFKLTSPKGKTIYIDPWLDNPKAPPGAKLADKADIIALTHGHFDHMGNTVELAIKTGAKVVCNFEISLYLKSKGVPEANIVGINVSGSAEIESIKFTMVRAEHSSGITDGERVIDGGVAGGFVINLEDGFTVYHTGDTGFFSDMKTIAKLYKPQLAMMCIGGFYTMGPTEAAEAIKLLRPKFVVPMHFGTFPALSGSPEALRKLIPKSIKTRIEALKPGDVLE